MDTEPEAKVDADGSTVPNSPDAESGDAARLDEEQVFAWLRPMNDIANTAFNATVDMVIKHTPVFDHFRSFLHYRDSHQPRSQSVFTEDDDDSNQESPPAHPYRQWSGSFGLCLNHLPCDPGQGWRVGTNSKEIDILLAPPRSFRNETQIAGYHGTLKLHMESCRILLQARHTITVGRDGPKAFRYPETLLLEPGEIIFIGNCTYTFEYTKYFYSEAFKHALTRYMRNYHDSSWSINQYVTPGSIGIPTVLGEYYCSPRAFNQGTFGKISAGWDKTGDTVAFKIFKAPKESQPNILYLLDCISHFDIQVPDACCVYTPLTSSNLADVITNYNPDINAKFALFADYLSGMSYLHDQKGTMHRDISPGHLAITSFDKPKGIIIDLDAATRDPTSTNHMKGTLPFLAPEILALKSWKGTNPQPPAYDRNVDTWALGLVMYALFTGYHVNWATYGAKPQKGYSVATVTPKAYAAFGKQLSRVRQSWKNSA
ncbi:MAG: hypothetical protein Q9216_005710, partial [Gyalolechia sp. 2 TL-2023]